MPPRPHQRVSPHNGITFRLLFADKHTQTSCTLSGLLLYNFWFYAIGVASAGTFTAQKFLFPRNWHDFYTFTTEPCWAICKVKIFAYGWLKFFFPASQLNGARWARRRGRKKEKLRYGSNLRPVIEDASIQNYHLELRLYEPSKPKFTAI